MLVVSNTRSRGYSLIEFMIAMTISLLIMAGLTTLFVENSRARTELERTNIQIENGRYAIDLLTNDLRLAGYLAEYSPTLLTTPVALPDPCATAVANLKSALPLHVQGIDNAAATPSCLSDVKAGTDILVIRRAATCVAGSADCANNGPYFQTTLCADELEAGGDHYDIAATSGALTAQHKRKPAAQASGCGAVADLYRYLTYIYFIANNDNDGDGIPTLKRAELGAGGFTIVPLVEGIEDMQLEYGIDLPTVDGIPDNAFVTDPGAQAASAGKTVIDNWRYVVAAKINLLARSTEQSAGYTDEKTYTLGLKADGTANTVGPLGDSFKRHAYESVVRLNNPAGRNQS